MKTPLNFFRVALAAMVAFCAQPAVMWAQQSPKFSIDSVTKQVRSHPKPKKTSIVPATATKASPDAPSAKAKREVPSIVLPAAQPATAPRVAKKPVTVSADSTPAVRRAPKASKPPR